MKPIYEPKARAKEYGDLAINIYTGCNHGCYYCFAPRVLHKRRETFEDVQPRLWIVDAVKRQLEREQVTGKLIHLCFTCDPYPAPPVDTTPTREIIKAIKESGNRVQILTKGDGSRDFDLLDANDWYGISYTGYPGEDIFRVSKFEPFALPAAKRLRNLDIAHNAGIKTWMSMEPVLNAVDILNFLALHVTYVDKYKIGKLNYHASNINWAEFGRWAEQICQSNHMDYYIKDDLRREMEVQNDKAGDFSGHKADFI